MIRRFPFRVLTALLLSAALAACAGTPGKTLAVGTSGEAPGQTLAAGAPVAPPAGFIGYCMKYLGECAAPVQAPATVELSEAKRGELEQVQESVNRAVQPQAEPEQAWDYPTSGAGDCNSYALEKRRELMALGWPRSALLLTAALTERGEGHLVLLARTSEGDLVLDNRLPRVAPWRDLPYRWLARQSDVAPLQWVGLPDRASVYRVAAAALPQQLAGSIQLP
ncbi:MAG TPA: transglutaminase-like cysteine peptidase [Stellaceae bacterium]|nr:transglutaminase-like cysteine peptidase [Stellaceae bacterium]